MKLFVNFVLWYELFALLTIFIWLQIQRRGRQTLEDILPEHWVISASCLVIWPLVALVGLVAYAGPFLTKERRLQFKPSESEGTQL